MFVIDLLFTVYDASAVATAASATVNCDTGILAKKNDLLIFRLLEQLH